MPDEVKKPTLKERLLALMQFRNGQSKADMSDSDLRQAISAALRAEEPGYLGIDSVFSADKLVVYAVMPEDQLVLFRRGYKLKTDGSVTLEASKEEVQPVTRYEPVGASATPCGCQGSAEQEAAMKTKAERIKALVENKFNPFKDQKALEAADDKALDSLEKHCTDAEAIQKAIDEKAAADKKVADDKAAADKKAADDKAAAEAQQRAASEGAPKVTNLKDYIAAAPPEVREMLEENIQVAKAQRVLAIKALKDTGRCDFSDAELEAKSVSEIQRLVKLAGGTTAPVDFSARGLPRAASTSTDDKVPAPPDFHTEVRAAAAK